MNHDVGLRLGGFAGHSHIGEDGQLGETCHIIMTFNLIAEEGHEEENQGGDGQTKQQGNEHDHRGLRAHLASCCRLIDETALVGSSSE